jgi:hypothetical protein
MNHIPFSSLFRRFQIAFCATLFLAFAACASHQQWHAEQIPLPRSTPFDADEFARNAYLEGFRTGYRAEKSLEPHSADQISGAYFEARRLGYYAGAAEARRELSAPSDQTTRVTPIPK